MGFSGALNYLLSARIAGFDPHFVDALLQIIASLLVFVFSLAYQLSRNTRYALCLFWIVRALIAFMVLAITFYLYRGQVPKSLGYILMIGMLWYVQKRIGKEIND